MRLLAPLEQQRRQPHDRRQCGQQHRAQPVCSAIDDGGNQAARSGIFIYRRHQHDRIVDDDSSHAQKTHHGEHAHRHIPRIMAVYRADKAEWDDRHDDNGPRPASKDPREHQIYTNQREQKAQKGIVQKIALLLGKTRHAPFDLRGGGDARQDIRAQQLLDLGGAARIILGYIAGHADQAHAIFAPDGGKSITLLDRYDSGQRHIGTPGCAQLGPLQKIGRQLTLWQFDADLGAARADGKGCRLDPVQPGAQFTPQRADIKAERRALRRQIQHQLLLVIGQIILHSRHLREGKKRILQPQRRVLQSGGIRAMELHFEGCAPRPAAPAAKADRFGHGVRHDAVLKRAHKGKAAIGAQIGIDQLDRDTAKLVRVFRLRARQTIARIATDFGDDVADRVEAVFRFVFGRQFGCRPLHFTHHFQRFGPRRAGRHGKITGDAAFLGRIEKPPGHIAPHKQRRLRRQQKDDPRQHRIARPDDPRHQRTKKMPALPFKSCIHHARRRIVPMRPCGCRQRVAHVIGQDQETFDQRCGQHHDHGKGNICDQIAEPARNHRQPQKRDHRGQRGGKDRHCHAPGGPFGGGRGRLAQTSEPGIGMFAHHDGIVDHDAKGDDQREKRDHVDRDPGRIHQRRCRQQRHGDARRHPERGAGVQEQKKQPHHQCQPQHRVIQQRLEPARDLFGSGADEIDGGPLGQGAGHVAGNLFNLFLDADCISPVRTVNAHRHGRIAPHEIPPLARRTETADRRHIAHPEGRAARIDAQGDGRNLVRVALLHTSAHARIGAGHIACGVCIHLGTDSGGNLRQRDVIGHQRCRGHFDKDLGRRVTPYGGAGHPHLEEARHQLVRVEPQLVHADRTGDDHICHPV